MCESRVLPCPKGSAVRQKGETREEGGHMLDMFALSYLSLPSRKGVQHYLFCGSKNPVNRRGLIFAYFLQCLVAEFYHVKLAHNFTDEEADTNRDNKQAQGNAKAQLPVGYDAERSVYRAKHAHKT